MDPDEINRQNYRKVINLTTNLKDEDLFARKHGDIPLSDITPFIKKNQIESEEISVSRPAQARSIFVEKEKEENLRKWMISNCKDVTDALQFFESPSLMKELADAATILVIRFDIHEDFMDLNPRETRELSSKCIQKTILIMLMSKEACRFSIFWKTKELDNLSTLKPLRYDISEEHQLLHEFVVDFLTNSLKDGHMGIHNCYSQYSNNATKIEIHFLADKRDYNLLLIAAETGKSEVAKMLLDLGVSPSIQGSCVTAQSLAFEGNNFNVLLMLFNQNLTFPPSMDIKKCSEEIQKFYETTVVLHNMILARHGDKVTEILRENRHLRHFYNISNESALKIAIDNRLVDMYEILMVHKVIFGPHEDVGEIMDQLEYNDKKKLREIHVRHSVDMPEKHINILMANSYVGHEEVTNVQEKLDRVQNAFKVLSQNPFIKTILMIVAASKKFGIIFDFKRNSVELLDPTMGPGAEGVFYLSGRMFIGAKQLLDEATQHEAFGTIAHELCHYAMCLVFKNDANPYSKNDNELKQKIEESSQECEKNQGKEKIVDLVYECYPEDMYHAELIVRPVHIMAYYHNQPEKLEEARANFPKLFNLYEEKIFPAIEQAIPEVEAQVMKENAQKDKEILNLKKRFFISIAIFIVIMVAGGIFGYKMRYKTYKFDKLSSDNKKIIQNYLVKYANIDVPFIELFPNGSRAFTDLESSLIKEILDGDARINISDEKHIRLAVSLNLNWTTLAKSLKDKLLNTNCNFQSVNVTFKELNRLYPKAFNYLSSDEIKQILITGIFSIGKVDLEDEMFYIERYFIADKSECKEHGRVKRSLSNTENEEDYDINEHSDEVISSGDYDDYDDSNYVTESSADYETINHESNEFEEFEKSEECSKPMSLNEIIEKLQNDYLISISDEAGTGKTASLKLMRKILKTKFPLRWVSYVNANAVMEFYDRPENIKDLNRLFGIKASFEQRIFFEALEVNNVVILWDDAGDFHSIHVFKEIHENSKNLQVISSKPYFASILTQNIHKNSLWLVPLDTAGQSEFLSKYLKFSNKNGSVVSDIVSIIDTIQSISPSNDFSNPLMLQTIANIKDVDVFYRKNLYEIFLKIFQTKLELWQQKSTTSDSYIIQIITDQINVMKVFQYYGLYHEMFKLTSTIHYKIKHLLIFNYKYAGLTSRHSEIAEMGILHDSNDYYDNEVILEYRTLAEFFIAQYLIDNIYSDQTFVNERDAEIRLSLFFYFARSFGHHQQLITIFIADYLRIFIGDSNELNFIILNSLKTQFRNSFIDLLGTEFPEIFEILIDFFKIDRNALNVLFLNDENETFITAIFNPIYNAYHVNPLEIISMIEGKEILSDIEMSKLINGVNQEGTIILGKFHYRNSNVPKEHPNLKDIKFSIDSTVCDLINVLNNTLNDDQWNEFLKSKASSILVIDYIFKIHKKNASDEFLESDSIDDEYCSEIDVFWSKIANLSEDGRIIYFGNAIESVLKLSITNSLYEDREILKFVLDKTENFVTSQKIYELFDNYNLLHSAAYKIENFKILWDFFNRHVSNKKNIRDILSKYNNSTYLYEKFDLIATLNNSTVVYQSCYYDYSPLNVIYTAILSSDNSENIEFLIHIYNSTLDVNELRQIFTSLIYDYEIFTTNVICANIRNYMLYLFQYNKNFYKNYLKQKNIETREGKAKYISKFNLETYERCGLHFMILFEAVALGKPHYTLDYSFNTKPFAILFGHL